MPKVIDNIRSKPDASTIEQDVEVALLEFVGTFLFLLLALGGIQAGAISNQAYVDTASQGGKGVPTINQLMHSAACLGLSLLVSAWLFYRVTGGIFNPAVSTALFLIGVIGPIRWALCCFAQMIGGIAASAVLLALLPGPLVVNTIPGTNVSKSQAVFIEMFMTAVLVLSVLMLATEKHKSTAIAPIGIGLTLFACELFGGIYTGGSLNTARSFGPAVVTSFDASHWVYWLGPFLGSILATIFYSLLKHIRYWRLNPDQDIDDVSRSPTGPIDSFRGIDSIMRGPNTGVDSAEKGTRTMHGSHNV